MGRSSIDFKEVLKFEKLSENWWSEADGESAMLHKMNPLRIEYILQQVKSLKDKKVLEVGCGGGILSIPLIRLNANLTAIEPSNLLYKVAINKAQEEGLKANFLNCSIEECTEENFDIILIMDVLEHVQNQTNFLIEIQKKVKKGGFIIISTINKTLASYLLIKYVAEGLKFLPKGTHDIKKFISPQSIKDILQDCTQKDSTGFFYNPLCKSFKTIKNLKTNYFLTLIKN